MWCFSTVSILVIKIAISETWEMFKLYESVVWNYLSVFTHWVDYTRRLLFSDWPAHIDSNAAAWWKCFRTPHADGLGIISGHLCLHTLIIVQYITYYPFYLLQWFIKTYLLFDIEYKFCLQFSLHEKTKDQNIKHSSYLIPMSWLHTCLNPTNL